MVLLQACASVLPPATFLKTVLARAELLDDDAAAADDDDAAAAPAAAASAAADVSSPRAPPPPSAPLLPLRSSTSAADSRLSSCSANCSRGGRRRGDVAARWSTS